LITTSSVQNHESVESPLGGRKTKQASVNYFAVRSGSGCWRNYVLQHGCADKRRIQWQWKLL